MGYSDRVFERFADCPGIIEITWVSDDPDYHRAPEDMFKCQEQGIPEEYGKKDKRTTEQAIFHCCVCECPSASIKTLRAHCEGTQHKRKAEQFFQQYQYKERRKSETSADKPEDSKIRLKDVLRKQNDYDVVGIQFVEEYTGERNDPPIYMCPLRECKRNNSEFYGNAEKTFAHLKSESHCWSYFYRLYGNEFHPEDYVLEDLVEDVLKQERKYRYREYFSDVLRDYNSVKIGHRPDSSYVREAVRLEKERKEPRIPLPKRRRMNETKAENDYRMNDNNAGNFMKDENMSNNGSLNGYGQKRRMDGEGSTGNHNKSSRSSFDEGPILSLPSYLQIQAQPDLSLVDDNDTSVKNTRGQQEPHSNQFEDPKEETQEDINGNTAQPKATPLEPDPVKKFNLEIANWIMCCMNKYYQYENNRDTCERKIQDANEYQELARSFSRKHRKIEKESFISSNGTLDGIQLNLDMKDRLKLEIDMFFEKREAIPLD